MVNNESASDRGINQYPKEVLTKSKKGKIEVRSLIDRGEYVRYEYLDPATGKKSENKIKLVLYNKEKGIVDEYFIIPLKQSDRFLLLKTEIKGNRKLWDKGQIVSLF
ncbi:MAG: hypothetical protein ACTSSJ_06550 [Candidatus Odinarchaeia archaeon]